MCTREANCCRINVGFAKWFASTPAGDHKWGSASYRDVVTYISLQCKCDEDGVGLYKGWHRESRLATSVQLNLRQCSGGLPDGTNKEEGPEIEVPQGVPTTFFGISPGAMPRDLRAAFFVGVKQCFDLDLTAAHQQVICLRYKKDVPRSILDYAYNTKSVRAGLAAEAGVDIATIKHTINRVCYGGEVKIRAGPKLQRLCKDIGVIIEWDMKHSRELVSKLRRIGREKAATLHAVLNMVKARRAPGLPIRFIRFIRLIRFIRFIRRRVVAL